MRGCVIFANHFLCDDKAVLGIRLRTIQALFESGIEDQIRPSDPVKRKSGSATSSGSTVVRSISITFLFYISIYHMYIHIDGRKQFG